MARAVGYRAGTAYVTVVPEFGDAQKVIARKFNEMIKDGVSDKDIEDQIAKRIEKGIEEGYRKGLAESKKHLEKSDRDRLKAEEKLKSTREANEEKVRGLREASEEKLKGLKEANEKKLADAKTANEKRLERLKTANQKRLEKAQDAANKKLANADEKLAKVKANNEKAISDLRKKNADAELKYQIDNADLYKKTMREAIKEHGKELDAIHHRFGRKSLRGRNGLAEPFHEARRAVEALNKELDKGFSGDSRVLEKQYKNLTDSIERMKKVARNPGDMQSLKRMSEETAKYRDIIEGRMTSQESQKAAQELKAHNERMARVEKEAQTEREAAALRRRQADRRDRILRYQEAERARLQGLKEIEDAADASNRARVGSTRNIGQGQAGNSIRERRLIEARHRASERLNKSITNTMGNLSRLAARRVNVNVVTAGAVKNLNNLETRMKIFGAQDLDKKVDIDINKADFAAEVADVRAMLNSIPDEEVTMDLDDKAAMARLAKFRAELERVRKRMDMDLDVHGLNEARADIARLAQQAQNIRGDIKMEVGDDEARVAIKRLEIALDNIKDKKVGVDLRESEARAQIAEIDAMLTVLDRKKVNIPVDIDVRKDMLDQIQQFNAHIGRTDNYMRSLNKSIKNASISLTETTQAFRIFSPVLTAVVFAGSPLVNLIGGITAGLGAVTSLIPGAVGGFSVLAFAFGGLSDAAKKYEDAQEALAVKADERTKAQEKHIAAWREETDEIGKATVSFIEYTDELKDQLAGVQMAAREGLFPGVESGLRTILDVYAEPFSDFMFKMGQGFGTFADHWARLLASPSAQEWFGRVARDANVYSGHLLIAGENFAAGLAHVVDAYRPAMRSLMTWIVDVSEGFRSWGDNLTVDQRWLDFMGTVRRTMPMFTELLGNVTDLFMNLTIALEPFTTATMNAVNGFLDLLNAMDPKMLGAILGAVGGLAGGLMILSGVMASVGGLAAIVKAAAGSMMTTIATGLAGFVATSSAALGASVALGTEGLSPLQEAVLGLSETLYIVRDASAHFWGLLGNLFDAVEPLLPIILNLGDSILITGAAFVDFGAGILGGVIDSLGWVIDLFSGLDSSTQTVLFTLGLLALSFGKIKSGVEVALEHGKGFLEWGEKLGDSIMGSISNVGAFGEKITSLATGMDQAEINAFKAGDAFDVMAGRADGAGGKVRGMLPALAGLGAAAAAVGALTLAVTFYAKAQEEAKQKTEDAQRAIELQGKAAIESGRSVMASLEELFGSDEDDTMLFGLQKRGISTLADEMERLATQMSLPGGLADERLKDNLKTLDETLSGMVKSGSVPEAIAVWDEFSATARAAGVDVEALAGEYLPDFAKELGFVAKELGVAISEQEILASLAKGEVPEALASAMESSDKYKDGMARLKGETAGAEQKTRDLMAASDELAGRFASAEEAQIAYRDKIREAGEAIAETGAITDWASEQGDKYKTILVDISKRGMGVVETQAKQGASERELQGYMQDTYDSLVKTAKQMGMGEDQAVDYARELLGIPDDVPTSAYIKNYARRMREIEDMDGSISDLERDIRIEVLVEAVYKDFEKLSDLQKKNPGARVPSPYTGRQKRNHDGGVLEPMADGGLRSMKPIAQMVQPNTWRVVGDRMDVDEAYIPLDGSARSKSILLETMLRMPGMFMAKGGILGFAAGGVATPGASAGGATDATMAPVSEAFAALEAALREGFANLLADMLGAAQAFFAELLAKSLEFNSSMLAQDAAWRAAEARATQDYLAASTGAWAAHRASLTAAAADFRSSETSAESAYLSTLLASTQAAQGNLRSLWQTTYADLASRGASYRSSEAAQFSGFYSGLMSQMSAFGSNARAEWSRIWTDLVITSASIFGRLPSEVASILVDTSKKLNTHIVDPFNKVIKDFDIKKVPSLGKFPTQGLHTGGHVKLATGGFMPGYTPGRDVHTFVSPTGGVLELSGGEPVLRPEAGKVLGRGWVDGVNMAARTGGVRGVQKFLSAGGQAFSTGGVWNNLWGIIHEQFPGARLTSAKRNGSGGSYHNTGRAIDIAGPVRMDKAYMMRMFNFIHDNYGNSAEVIYTPAKGRNILNGRYHEYSPAVKADHHDHVHWANRVRFSGVNGPPTGESAMGLFDMEGSMKGWVEAARKEVMDGFLPDVTMGVAGDVFSALAKQKKDAFITDHAHLVNDPGGPGGGVGRWRPMVTAALEHVGQSTSDAMQNIVLRRMKQESGGNPRAINLWDINARRGIPSKGLMQVIDPTFRAYRDRSLVNDIWDPMANIVASMRYALARYKSLPAAYNRKGGYAEGTSGIDLSDILGDMSVKPLLRDNGGRLPRGLSVIQNNLPHDETVVPYSPEQIAKILDGGPGAGGSVDMSTHFHGDLRGNPREIMEQTERIKRVAAIQRPIKF